MTERLARTDWTNESDAQAAYQLLYAFHANHLHFPGGNEHLRQGLRQCSNGILALIRQLLPFAAQVLFKTPVRPDEGLGGDAIDMLLSVYFYHTGLGREPDLPADAAGMLPSLVRASPRIGNGITFSLIRSHPERVDILCQLIELYLGAGADGREYGMFYDTMSALLENDGDSFAYDALDEITARLTGAHIDALRSLCNSLGDKQPAASRGARAPQFADLNFKLLVIQELMYEQETLLPRFDVETFVKEYTGREIMVKKEGYDVIPEVLGYFEALVIPPQLLARVEELSFDPSAEIYVQVFPYWDGEGDTFDVASVTDIGLLPNLKRMSSMPDSFVERYARVLGQRAIELD